MSHPVLVTGSAGGRQGATGRHIASLLLKRGVPVRAFVRKLDGRAESLPQAGAEGVVGDLLNPGSVQNAMQGIRHAYFTYPVDDGLVDAATIFAATAHQEQLEMVVNNSQFQDTPKDASFRKLIAAPSHWNLRHRLCDFVFDGAKVGAVYIQAPPYYENVRALVSGSVSDQDTVFLPWGTGDATFPLASGEAVALVAATLLAGPGLPSQTVYQTITETLTVQQIVDLLSSFLGHPIEYVPMTDEQWADDAKSRINAHALDHLASLWKYFRTRQHQLQTTDTVFKVTGQNPQSLEEFFKANLNFFTSAVHSSR